MSLRVSALLLTMFLTRVTSVDLLAPLPSIVTSRNEVFSLPLSDYFSGNNVNFTILNKGAMHADIEDPFSLMLVKEFQYRDENQVNWGRKYGVEMVTMEDRDKTYVISAYNNILQAYSLSLTGDVVLLWNFEILSPYNSPSIQRIRNLTSKLFILMSSNETVNGTVMERFDIYETDFEEFEETPEISVHLDLSEFEYFTNVDFITVDAASTESFQILLVSSTDVISMDVSSSYLMIYNITDLQSINLMQIVSAYHDIPGYPNGTPLTTVGMAYYFNTLFVLDKNIGLFTFNFINEYFFSSDYIDIIRFGIPVSISAPVGQGHYLVIGTTNGLLLIDVSQETYEEYKWIPSILADGNPMVPFSSLSNERYLFVNAQQAGSNSLLIIDYAQPFNSSIMRQWKFSKIIPEDVFIPNGMYMIKQLLDPKVFCWIRCDADALRVFNITVGSWALQGTASAAGPYSTSVLAVNFGNPLDTALSILYVEYIELTNSTIFIGQGYNLDKEQTTLTLVPMIAGTSAFVLIPISTLFSGPDMTISLSFPFVPPGLTLTYPPTFQKVSVVSSISTLDLTVNVKLLVTNALAVGFVMLYDDGWLWVYQIPRLELAQKIYLNESRPIDAVSGEDDDVFLLVQTSKATLELLSLSLYSPNTVVKAAVTPQSCFKLKFLAIYLACISPSLITLYSYSLEESSVITQARIGIDNLDIVDIEEQITDLTQHLFLYISCRNNGLLVVDITFNEVPLTALVAMSTATNGVILTNIGEVLVQGNDDGSLFVFDTECAPNISLVRTLPSWSSSPVSPHYMRLDGFLVAHSYSSLYLYDVLSSVHNSLYQSLALPSDCSLVGSSLFFVTLCFDQEATLTAYELLGVSGDSGFEFNYFVQIDIDLEITKWDFTQVNGTVMARNTFGEEAEVDIVLDIESQGHVVFQNMSMFPNSTIEVPYTDSQCFDIFSMFSGQNLKLYLNINGQYPLFPTNGSLSVPAVIWPPVQMTDQYEAESEIDYLLLLPNNYTLVIRGQQLDIIEIAAQANEDWQVVSNATLLATVKITEVVNSTRISTCSIATLVAFKDQLALIAFYCSGKSAYRQADVWTTTFDELFLVNFNVTELSFEPQYEMLLMFSPKIMKVRYLQSCVYLILIDGMEAETDGSSNHIVWYKFTWMYSGAVEFGFGPIIIDFYLLQLDSFCVADADIFLRDQGEAIIYVADVCYGVRAVEINLNTGKATLKSNWPAETITSVSTCGGNLYAMETSSQLFEFNISSPACPFEQQSTPPYNIAHSNFTALSSSLYCSSSDSRHGEFLASIIRDVDYGTSIRVFDLTADSDSSILRDIHLNDSDTYSIAFNEHNVFAASVFMSVKAWELIRPQLTIPNMTQEQYREMVARWGTSNFTVVITAVNDQMEINSSGLVLVRSQNEPANPNENNQSDSSSPYWWVWLLVAIVVVLSFVGAYIGFKVYQRKQEEAESSRIHSPFRSFHSIN